MSSPDHPDPIPPYGTPQSFGTPPPPGSSVTAELPTSVGAATWAEPAYRQPGPPAPAGVATAPPPAPAATRVPVQGGPPSPAHRSAVGAVRVLGVLVALGLVAGGVVTILIGFFSQSETTTASYPEITKLVTQTRTGDVRVRTGQPGQPVSVTQTVHWSFDKPTVQPPTVKDGVLTLASSCSAGWFVGHCSVDLDVTVPPGTRTDLRTATGDIQADLRDAPVIVHTSTGDVRIVAAGATQVEATTTTGDLNVRGDATSPRITARTTTGDVNVRSEAESAQVTAQTTTGDVDLGLEGVPSTVSARTTTGDIGITVPQAGYRVDTDTKVGDETVAEGLRDDASSRRITARATTGDIDIRIGAR